MDNETEIVKKYISNLPETLRVYLLKKTWIQQVSLIASTNKLTEDQTTKLNAEVFLTLIGMENYSDFTTNIQKNVAGIGYETMLDIIKNIEGSIFTEIKPYLLDIEKINNSAPEETPNKETVLNEIENPVPTIPVWSNPAGKNPILDAQHNLPEGEKKTLISSAAVPSRGPILGNYKASFTIPPNIPVVPKPLQTKPAPTVIPTMKIMPSLASFKANPQDFAPKPTEQQKPTTPIIQPIPKAPGVPIPPAPTKYTVDPYREPAE